MNATNKTQSNNNLGIQTPWLEWMCILFHFHFAHYTLQPLSGGSVASSYYSTKELSQSLPFLSPFFNHYLLP